MNYWTLNIYIIQVYCVYFIGIFIVHRNHFNNIHIGNKPNNADTYYTIFCIIVVKVPIIIVFSFFPPHNND